MIYTSDALTELGITGYSLSGEPTNEQEFNDSFKKVIGEDENGTAILSSDTTLFGVTWAEVQDKKNELITNEPLKLLRETRDRLIAETDWWASSDLTMSPERSSYRQALRDITETYSSLDDVVWPTKPE